MGAGAVTIRGVTTSPQHIRDVLGRHGLRPRQALGQNFVADANTVRRIARLAEVGPDSSVVEIGAGLGALTLALAETGGSVTAVEVDSRLVPVLRDATQGTAVRIVEADALTLDWAALLGDVLAGATRPDATLVANLPYNVAVPVLARVLDEAPAVTAMVVMVQREVGERLVAVPGTKAYGAVSVKVAYYATARIVGRVPASVFVPRPKVESVLVRIERRRVPAIDPGEVPAAHLFALVRAGFAHRRKMLRGALSGLVPAEAFASAGIDPAARAESLTVEAWGRLARCTIPSGSSAPAKLTLSLRVTGVRDGLHLLDAEMVSLDLADELTFSPGTGITVVDDVPGGLGVEGVPPGADNLVTRALDAVGQRAAVHLRKRIPAGAGLGGGSADAAAVLRWAGVSDLDTAMGLGSDVPFCVRGGRARVRGVGEVVDTLPFEPRTFLVLLCPLSVDTASVYAAYDDRVARTDGDAWRRSGGEDGSGNDLEAAALEVEPALARWRDHFAAHCGRRPRLAGSGSSWFVACEPGAPSGAGAGAPVPLETEDGRGIVMAVRTVPAEDSPGGSVPA